MPTPTGTLDGVAYVHTCPSCANVYHYDMIEEPPSRQEQLLGKTKPVLKYRDNLLKLPYVRVLRKGWFVVSTALLARHHAANERTQEAAWGFVDTERSYQRLLHGAASSWGSIAHAHDTFGAPPPVHAFASPSCTRLTVSSVNS